MTCARDFRSFTGWRLGFSVALLLWAGATRCTASPEVIIFQCNQALPPLGGPIPGVTIEHNNR